ncbi:ribonuclease H family protein [Salinicoccus sp. CNSTN-B1]
MEFAVDKALEHGYHSLIIHTDSKVIADSFDKNHVKNKVFRKYFMSVSDKIGEMALFIISWTRGIKIDTLMHSLKTHCSGTGKTDCVALPFVMEGTSL